MDVRRLSSLLDSVVDGGESSEVVEAHVEG